MTTYPFAYKVVIVDYEDPKKCLKECGLGFCTSFTHAVSQLEDYYGQDICKILDLELFEESHLLITTEQFVDEYAHIDYADYAVPCDYDGNTIYAEPEIVKVLNVPLETALESIEINIPAPEEYKTQIEEKYKKRKLNVDFKFKDEPLKEDEYDSPMCSL